jgi:hypothetical protein
MGAQTLSIIQQPVMKYYICLGRHLSVPDVSLSLGALTSI